MSNTTQIWATSPCVHKLYLNMHGKWNQIRWYTGFKFMSAKFLQNFLLLCLVKFNTLSSHDSLTYLSCATVNKNVIKFVLEIWACDLRLVTAGGHWAPWLLIGWLQPSLALIGWSQRLRSHWATAGAKRTPEAGARLSLVESRGQALSWLYPGLWSR